MIRNDPLGGTVGLLHPRRGDGLHHLIPGQYLEDRISFDGEREAHSPVRRLHAPFQTSAMPAGPQWVRISVAPFTASAAGRR